MAEDPKDLAAAAERAEAQAVALAQKLAEAEAAEAAAVERHLALISSGASGRPVAEASAARDAAQIRVRSARQDAEAGRLGAKAARRAAAEATFGSRTREVSERLAAVNRQLEDGLRVLAARWAAFEALALETRALGQELTQHEARHRIPPEERLPRPEAGETSLTTECYGIARRAAAALEVLGNLRYRAAHPAPPPPAVPRPFLVAGDSPRAMRQREALAAGAPRPSAPRLPPDCGAQPRARRRARAHRHEADRAQDTVRLRPLRHRLRARPVGRRGAAGAVPRGGCRGRDVTQGYRWGTIRALRAPSGDRPRWRSDKGQLRLRRPGVVAERLKATVC